MTLHSARAPTSDSSNFSEPQSWDDFVGNKQLLECMQDLVYNVRRRNKRSKLNHLIGGASRSGKTAAVELTVKALLCCNLDMDSLNPCGSCSNCADRFYKHGTGEWNTQVDFANETDNPTPVRSHFLPVDCARASQSDIESLLDILRLDDGNLKIVYLDEVHRLAHRAMDERFLKPLESYPAIWLASSAMMKGNNTAPSLDQMFQNRFDTKIETEKPSRGELANWLGRKCGEASITVEDVGKALPLLADRANRSPGLALQVLNRAYQSRKRHLTIQMIEKHTFSFNP